MQIAIVGAGYTGGDADRLRRDMAAWRRTGSLEHGKYADLLLLNVSDYREIPLYPGTNLVHAMIKRGAMLYQEEFPGWPAAVQS